MFDTMEKQSMEARWEEEKLASEQRRRKAARKHAGRQRVRISPEAVLIHSPLAGYSAECHLSQMDGGAGWGGAGVSGAQASTHAAVMHCGTLSSVVHGTLSIAIHVAAWDCQHASRCPCDCSAFLSATALYSNRCALDHALPPEANGWMD
jgi:hypothetical protein